MFFCNFHFFRNKIKKEILLNQIKKTKNKRKTGKKERKRCDSPIERLVLISPLLHGFCKRASICFLSKGGQKRKLLIKRNNREIFYKEKQASMTVEAALVLPLFMFAFLNIMSVMEVYRLQSNLSMAMYHTVKEMAVYGHAYSQFVDDDTNRLESYGLTYLYGAGRVRSCMEDTYVDNIPVAGGFSSIHWLYSQMMQNQCIDLVATYHVKPMVGLMGFTQIPMYNRMRTRAWTGYDIPLVQEALDQERIVYITPEGEAYHLTKSCSYLRLSIRSVSRKKVGELRNQDREKYVACQQCSGKENNTVFITLFGNKYHTTLQCGALKRTIEAVPISQIGQRHICQKCGNL